MMKSGLKSLPHHVDGEVVIYASVVHQHPIEFGLWLEHQRKTIDARTASQTSVAEDHLVLVVDIAGHTAERYEQTVEIASALIGVRE